MPKYLESELDLHEFILDTFYFLIATLVFIPFFKWIKLGSTFGYIVAGILTGPFCLELIDNSKSIFQLAELGICLLLFVVGLELTPLRLKKLKFNILFYGGLQMAITTLAFTAISMLLGLDIVTSIIVGVALSLSSTAYALSHLTESSQLTTSHGQISLSVLLFQDLMIVPLLALVPLIGLENYSLDSSSFIDTATKIGLLVGMLAVCFFALRPAINILKIINEPQVSLVGFLFFIIGMALGMQSAGLSMAIGCFVAGVFLASSEVKVKIKSLILPFKGVLMGLFFMTLGVELDLLFIVKNALLISAICLSIFIIKTIVLVIINRFKNGNYSNGIKISLTISQSGEFGVVLLLTAAQTKIIGQELSSVLGSCIVITMIIAPLLAKLYDVFNFKFKHEDTTVIQFDEISRGKIEVNQIENGKEVA